MFLNDFEKNNYFSTFPFPRFRDGNFLIFLRIQYENNMNEKVIIYRLIFFHRNNLHLSLILKLYRKY